MNFDFPFTLLSEDHREMTRSHQGPLPRSITTSFSSFPGTIASIKYYSASSNPSLLASFMASATRAPHCRLRSPRSAVRSRGSQSGPVQVSVPKHKTTADSESTNIVLQPRLSNLRAYGSDRVGVIKTRNDADDGAEDVSPFFATLSDYIESYKKSQDFETISGRLAMMVFAVTVTKELMTGSSVFGKMDIEGLTEAGGVCLAAVACAALFAWFSSARTRVGRIFSVGCNSFIDSVIDQIVDGLFYESDWSDEL